MIKINNSLYFRFKLKLILLISINNKIDNIFNIIYGIMRRINSSFKNNIIPQYKYNLYLSDLDKIMNKFNKLNRPFRLKDFVKYSILEINSIIQEIFEDLNSLIKNSGAFKIFDIIYLNTLCSEDILKNNNNEVLYRLLIFYNNVFTPTSSLLYDNSHILIQKKTNEINSKNITDLTIFDSNMDSKNETNYDYYQISKIKDTPICSPIKKQDISIIETINGARLYIPFTYTRNKKIIKKYLVMNGYFNDDPLNISRINGTIGRKNINLLNLIKTLNINEKFKFGYIEQLSLRDFLSFDNENIIEKCLESYQEVLKLKNKTISSLVKDFLLSNIGKQRHILTLFLLLKDDIETQYLAHLMYDMITNESYLLKPQPLAEQVYNSLHWSIKKLFKVAIKRVSDYNKKILNFNNDDIPYEKRICLLKAPDYVKAKAMDKFKEISNKGNDNSSKCQQYLDGLLRIPFGIYKKETIINFLTLFKEKIKIFISETINVLSVKKKNTIISEINTDLLLIFNNYHNIRLTSNHINKFINTTQNYLSNIINNYINDININDNEYVTNLINTFDKKSKVLDYKKILNLINNDLIDKIDTKCRKKDLKTKLLDYLIDLKDNSKKQKLIYYIKNKERNIDDILDLISSSYGSISSKLEKLRVEWLDYTYKKKDYLKNIDTILDKAVYGQKQPKLEIKRIIAQWINGEMKGYVFGFEGPPGTGKTSIAQKGISKCLLDESNNSRPFTFIALGGSSNGSTLEGHSYTYVGSTWGKIVDVLIESNCMNPIIFIDELDKVSKTEHGREIIGILTHLTDSSQNTEFCDKYFSGIKLDLSKVLFIFSYNDYSLIDPILADRIHRVKFTHLSKDEKIHIIQNYLLPELLETVGYPEDLEFPNDVIEYIILNYTFEAGIRKLKEKIFEIIREINLRSILEEKNIKQVDKDLVDDIFEKKPKIVYKKIAKKPLIGLVNGLYATTSGIGGLTIIETFKTPSESKLSLILTGQQGDVMQESVKCAKTIAWNLIPSNIKSGILKEFDNSGNFGIHVHCPEAATPKDGPSAGTAITVAIISLLTNIPVKNNVALTGEIDLNGSVHQIGGLDFKIEGGKMAGADTILYPESNQQDVDIYKKDKPEIIKGIKLIPVNNIWQVLNIMLVENNIKFNKYLENKNN